jgi:two-component SAPR family response regulator
VPAYYLGDMEQAVAHLDTAIAGLRGLVKSSQGSTKNTYLYDLAECLNDLGLIYIDSGQMLNAQKAFQESLEIHIGIRSNLGALASVRNNIAYLNHQIGHYPEAWKQYSLALENARSANWAREQIAILIGRGELLLDIDEREEAREQFEQALEIGRQRGEAKGLSVAYAGLARVERLNGSHNEAMNFLRQAASRPLDGLDPLEYTVELGQIYSDMGQIDLAQKQFHSAIRDWPTDMMPKQQQILAAFLGARGYFKSGELNKAQNLLKQALEGAAQLGYDQFLISVAHRCSDFIESLKATPPSAQLTRLLERVDQFEIGKSVVEPKVDDVEVPAMHLEVQAFGAGGIRRNGEILASTAWRSSRARALFYYILGEGKARKESIGLEFWPDFSVGKISSNFHATLWRVRQAIGSKEAIVFEDDLYSLHPAIQIWYDVTEFRNYLTQAAVPTLSDTERSELLRQAVRLYQGPFLQDLYMDWADRQREELRNLYIEALVRLATLETQAKRHKDAKDIYEKIVAIDPYRDEVHLALMKSLVFSGSPSAAIAHFKRYKLLLRKELNAEPLEELQNYYDQLAIKA